MQQGETKETKGLGVTPTGSGHSDEPASGLAADAGSVPNAVDEARYEYRFTSAPWCRERHDWLLVGAEGAINVWAEPTLNPIEGRRWYGGIECHHAAPPDHADFCGFREDCDIIGGKCWHDGSSLQFSGEVEPMLPMPNGQAIAGRLAPLILPILRHRYRTWFAQAIEARSGQTEGLDPQGESAVAESDAPDPQGQTTASENPHHD